MKNKKDTLIGNGFIWVSTSIVSVIFPTALAYLFEFISQEKVPNIKNYFDSILLIVFSISCSLIAICLDSRSKSINTKCRELTSIFSFIVALIFGSYHFYIIGRTSYKISNIFLIISFCIVFIFSIIGFLISHHHNLYDDSIEHTKDYIKREKEETKKLKK